MSHLCNKHVCVCVCVCHPCDKKRGVVCHTAVFVPSLGEGNHSFLPVGYRGESLAGLAFLPGVVAGRGLDVGIGWGCLSQCSFWCLLQMQSDVGLIVLFLV